MSFLQKLFKHRGAAVNAPAIAVVAPPPPTPPPTPPPVRAEAAPPQEDCITLSLKAITDLFPPELRGAIHKQPSEHVHVQIPRSLIQPQLAAGAVRITFAQLRAAAPEIFFNALGTPPDARVLLPLESVLKQMMPARREDQRQPSVPVNIPSVFAKADRSGQPRPQGAAARGSTDPWYSQRRPAYQAEPEPDPAPSVPPNGKKPFIPLASARLRRDDEPAAAQTSPIAPAPTAAAAPPIAPAPAAAPAPSPNSFALPLATVLAALPPEIRHALNAADAQAGSFLIPIADFDARMRTGRLVFKWGQLRDWCSVPLSATAAPDMDIEIPLAPVVPLFMAARGTLENRKQVEVDSRIPDVFGKTKGSAPQPAEAPASTPAPAPAPAPVRADSIPAPIPTPPQQPAAAAGTAPAKIVESLRSLAGVAGAFIATADGLLVSGDVPTANENVLAAFAPTVFAQLTKYADMARLGLPEAIDIHLGDAATVHVRKVGKLFVGLLTERGRSLPVQELTRISNALQTHAS